MSSKFKRFANKYGKKYGGDLTLEGCVRAKDTLKHKDLPDIDVPDKIVTLTGYLRYSSPALRIAKGSEGTPVRTGYVVGLAVHDGNLFAITTDHVYRLVGPWVPKVITEDPFLNSIWKDVRGKVLDKSSRGT